MPAETSIEKHPRKEANAPERTRGQRSFTPSVDIIETKDEVLVLADMPGASGKDIDVHFENGELVLHARVGARQPEDPRYLLQEYGLGDFNRSFEISETIDAGRISAEYEHGVLKLHLPKVEAVKPRKIAVKSN